MNDKNARVLSQQDKIPVECRHNQVVEENQHFEEAMLLVLLLLLSHG